MRLEELKKSFWGYQRDAVFQYISQQEERFAQKMAEKDAQLEQASQRDSARIQALEQENRILQEELGHLRERQDQISQAILDARSSAEILKAESRAKEEAARENVRQALEADLTALEKYRDQVFGLRQAIQTALEHMEQQTETFMEQAEDLIEASPKGNLKLFQ